MSIEYKTYVDGVLQDSDRSVTMGYTYRESFDTGFVYTPYNPLHYVDVSFEIEKKDNLPDYLFRID